MHQVRYWQNCKQNLLAQPIDIECTIENPEKLDLQNCRNPGELTGEHIAMVEKMGEIAREILAQQGASPEDSRLGFHWPPFLRVQHLHLHILNPPSSMGWFARHLLFRENSFAFMTHAAMLDRLRSML